MNLRTLRAFVEVVRQGGFTQAAEVVSVTQSSISKSVRTLEQELDTPLLQRASNKVELTAAGQIVYRRALAMLGERAGMAAELDGLRGLTQGVLRIGIPPVGSGALFARLFAEYRRRHPGIEIELVEHGSQRLYELLAAGEIELAALLAPVGPEFDSQDVRIEPLVALMASGHPLAGSARVDFAALAGSSFILFEAGFALNRIILDACERRGVRPHVTARSAQLDFIADLVAAGVGVAFFPRLLAGMHARPDVAQVPLDEPGTDWHLALAWRRAAHLSPAARAWLELASA
ncbi:LysR family transcriptional regulator [Oxalobacteraceae bacterium A2-2]